MSITNVIHRSASQAKHVVGCSSLAWEKRNAHKRFRSINKAALRREGEDYEVRNIRPLTSWDVS